jgi:hypothetical protein
MGPSMPTVSYSTFMSLVAESGFLGNGFYLFGPEKSKTCDQNSSLEGSAEKIPLLEMDDEEDETPVQIVIVSLWYWWYVKNLYIENKF